MSLGKVVILHEWDGKPYYWALDHLVRTETGQPPLYREVWLIRQMAVGLIRRKAGLVLRSLRNLLFFLRSFFLRDHIIVLGIAPFDPGLIFWSRLRRRNTVIYHTSWLKWDGSDVPKRSPILSGWIRRRWREFLEDPRVRVVSILEGSKADMLRHYRKDPGQFTVIPHALDFKVFANPSRAPAGPVLKVAYVGRLNARKGIDVVADLIARADPARFRIGVAGEGPEWKRLEPLHGRFDYHGFLSEKAQVARLLAGYDVMILPSFFEPFGIALVEAMACGVVCVVSDGLFPKDLVVDGKNGLMVARTAEAFLAALDRLHGDRALLERFRESGLERVKEFELEAIGARWRRLLLP